MATYGSKLKTFNVMRLEKSMVAEALPLKHLFSGGKGVSHVVQSMNEIIRDASFKDDAERSDSLFAADPASSAWHRYGFARIMDVLPFLELEWEDDSTVDPNDTVFIRLDNNQIFGILERRERILPGDTLRAAMEKEGNKLAKRQGEPLNRKQWAEIKDVVAARLLAKALIKSRFVPVLFQKSMDDADVWDVFYFTSSHKLIEDCNAALFRRAFGSYPVYPFENDLTLPVKNLLTKILNDQHADQFPWRYFVPGMSAKMVDNLSGGSAYSFKDQILRSDGEFDSLVKDALDQGYLVENMAMKFTSDGSLDAAHHYATLKLNAKGVFSSLKFSDVLVAERGSVEDSSAMLDFNAYMLLLSDQLRKVVGYLQEFSSVVSPDKQKDTKPAPREQAPDYDENDEL